MLHNNTWCIFFDDDDYCPPCRAEVFMKCIERDGVGGGVFWVPALLRLNVHQDVQLDETFCNSCLEKGVCNAQVVTSGEYVSYAVKINTLKSFCAVLLKHKLLDTHMCDVLFGLCLWNATGNNFKIDETWLYAYKCYDSPQRVSCQVDLSYYVSWYNDVLLDDLSMRLGFRWIDKVPRIYGGAEGVRFNKKKCKNKVALVCVVVGALLALRKRRWGGRAKCVHMFK